MKALKYFSLTLISIKNNFTYLKAYVISKIFFILILFVMKNLYSTIYKSTASFDGFTIQMILYYIVITESIILSSTPIYKKISDEIKDGSCTYNLLRPISYISYHYFTSMGEILLNFNINLLIGLITVSMMVGFNIVIIKNIIFSLPVIFLGINLNFFIMIAIGMLSFEMEEVSPVFWIYQKILFIIGGLFFPIEFFPQWIKKIAVYLPTSYILYFPARLSIFFNLKYYFKGILIQIFYIGFVGLISILIYKNGIKKVTINGG